MRKPRLPLLCGIWLAMPLFHASIAHAKVVPGPAFTDHAVLQQGKPVNIWGSADPGEAVTVRYEGKEGISRTASTTANTQGTWTVELKPLPATSHPGTLTFQGSNTIVYKDILVGEVWLAAGQSNMDTALFWTPRGKKILESADYPQIRYFKVGTTASDHPRSTLKGRWAVCAPKSAGGFTELGFHFARELHEKLGVPVGIINSSWGGTGIEAWMDTESLAADQAGASVQTRWQEALAQYPEKQAKYEQALKAWTDAKTAAEQAGEPFKKNRPHPPSHKPGSQYTPSGLYNAMISPLVPYSLRGIIWYQGENNAQRPQEYRTLFPSLISGWRRVFTQGDLPFYWVQLPGYNIGEKQADWAGLREAQDLALSLSNTGQAVTIDIGDPKEIHPNNKPEVAHRLALIALRRTYGHHEMVDRGPRMSQAEFLADGSVRLSFSDLEGGLKADKPAGFEIAGLDGAFHPASALVEENGRTVLVRSDKVSTPENIRYAWKNNPGPLQLQNQAGLPAAPFKASRQNASDSSTH